MKPKKNQNSKWPLFLLAGIGTGLFLHQLNHVSLSNYVIENDKIPSSFDGFRILHISDLHSNKLLCHNGKLISKIRALRPDIAVISGDIASRSMTDIDTAVHFARDLSTICDIYYIPGNHEAAIHHRDILFRQLKNAGATLLFDNRKTIDRGGDSISITGLMDPQFDRFRTKKVSNNMRLMLRLRKMEPVDESMFNILLSHRPEHLALYSNYGYDLVFSGHAHGGQWRVPAFGALYAPDQGVLPEYTGETHTFNGTTMVISRGLGNSFLCPVRINNPFELVVVTLKKT